MPLIRLPTPALKRPSIHDLRAFLFSPYTPPHHPSHSTHSNLIPKRRPLSPSTGPISSPKPKSRDRGPASTESTQTDFSILDVLGGTPAPSTSIDACLWNGFHLNSGVKIVGGSGVLLVGGEAFGWRPWEAGRASRGGNASGSGSGNGNGTGTGNLRLLNERGEWEVRDEAWGLLGLVWPKPDLLILGLGKDMRPLSAPTRRFVNSLGIRIDIQDTRNAAAQFNLLATERGVGTVAAALVPLGWRENVGFRS